ncbi:MAG: recombination mediator RecR [bacterium]
MPHPLPIQRLIDYFAQLPTVGPKTAERYVFYLLKQTPQTLQSWSQALNELQAQLTICTNCQAIALSSPCTICQDQKRQPNLLCVVADTRDLQAIEEAKAFNGYYHVLGGTLDTTQDWQTQQLTVKQLIQRLDNQAINEVVLAFNPDVSGETTSLYLTKILEPYKVKISKLAQGLSAGASLEYADPATLNQAFKYRNQIK